MVVFFYKGILLINMGINLGLNRVGIRRVKSCYLFYCFFYSYLVECGFIIFWGDMEIMWNYMYDNNLKLKFSEGLVLIIELVLNLLVKR